MPRLKFSKCPEPIVTLGKPLTLTGALRHETARARWAGKIVLIYSREHGAFWRHNRSGYTIYTDAAGRYDFAEAFDSTKHCDRSKGLAFYEVQP
jgi:hypothetical protein